MAKKMLVDATHPEETRVVVVDGNKVDDFDFESIYKRQLAGNIYLAKVTRVEPSLQAAFVEYGGNRHGFLAFSEIHPDYYQIPVADREALLEEERREEEARRAREEENDGQEQRSGRKRGRRNRRSERDQGGDNGSNAVAGLEVIEIDESEEDDEATDGVPRGLEIAEPDIAEPDVVANDTPAEGPLASVDPVGSRASAKDETVDSDADAVDTKPVDVDAGSATETDAETRDIAETAEAVAPQQGPVATEETAASDAVEESGTANDGPDEDGPAGGEAGDPDGPPRTVSEAAGLDDDERVVGNVDGGGARTVAGRAEEDTVRDVPEDEMTAVLSKGEDTVDAPAPQADAQAPGPVQASARDESPPDDPARPGDDEVAKTDAASAKTAGADDHETSDDDDSSDSDDDSDDGRGGRRGRRRRGRGRKGGRDASADDGQDSQDTAEKTGDDEDGAPDEPENVGAEDTLEEAAHARTRLRRKYKIQDVVKVRQIMLVQVVKEERGNKGAALTTYLSLAGRYCVLMPNTARGGGISRKITNAGDRKRLREIIGEMEVPLGMGLIVRTAGAERTRAEIRRDYEFLLRQWEQIRDLTLKSIAPTLIYEEGSLIKRSIRDIYNKDIDQILVEGETGYREAKEYMKMLMPSHAKNVQPYSDPIPLFSRYQVESYLNGMFNPTVQLKSGGYIVIGVTEALVAIDVNSGRATKQGSIEETALQTNLEAADEVARQLRLRDLAGLIVIDFIDMDENRNNRAVEKRMKDRLKTDRARIQVGRISAFGLMEMSRQRLRPGMLEATTQACPTCHGTGLIRSDESLTLSILRELEEEGLRGRADELVLRAPIDITNYLINSKRRNLTQIEDRHEISILLMADPALVSPQFDIERSKSSRPRPERQTDVVTAASVVEDDDLVEEITEDRDDREDSDNDSDTDGDNRNRRRRGRRGGRRRRSEDRPETEGQDETQTAADDESDGEAEKDDEDRPKRRRGRRRGGRNRRGDKDEAKSAGSDAGNGSDTADAAVTRSQDQAAATDGKPSDQAETAESSMASGSDSGARQAETPDAPSAHPEGSPETGVHAPETASPSDVDVAEAPEPVAENVSETAPDEVTPTSEVLAAAEEPTTEGPAPEDDEAAVQPPEPDEQEPAMADADTAEKESRKPKRRGWWSFGR